MRATVCRASSWRTKSGWWWPRWVGWVTPSHQPTARLGGATAAPSQRTPTPTLLTPCRRPYCAGGVWHGHRQARPGRRAAHVHATQVRHAAAPAAASPHLAVTSPARETARLPTHHCPCSSVVPPAPHACSPPPPSQPGGVCAAGGARRARRPPGRLLAVAGRCRLPAPARPGTQHHRGGGRGAAPAGQAAGAGAGRWLAGAQVGGWVGSGWPAAWLCAGMQALVSCRVQLPLLGCAGHGCQARARVLPAPARPGSI